MSKRRRTRTRRTTRVTIPDVKPGYNTTEFWLTTFTTLAGIATEFATPASAPKIGLIVSAVATAGYAISRGLVKKGMPEEKTV